MVRNRIVFVIAGIFLVYTPKVWAQKTEFLDPADVTINGLLGEAQAAARKGRLTELPTWSDGQLIRIFSREVRDQHDKMDWYGEHAGKWMYTTASAVRQSKNKELQASLLKTADYLVSEQAADGYLGDYGPTIRITSTTTPHRRSWDTWNLTYMTLGLLEVNKYFPNEKYMGAAKKIGELFLKTFGEGKGDITEYGTRHGISATIILDAVVELYKTTNDKRYVDFAEWIVRKSEQTEGVKFISAGLNNVDMENVGDGKAYQILWNLTAIAKLYEVTGKTDYLKAVENAWTNVRDFHLTIAGGPWGGIGKHLECFNRKNFWSPYGFVETCSTMSWIQLNKQMLHLTGDAKYAQEIERAAYNALLGARYANGIDWSYHSFSNGSWHAAHFNDCCPSSGVLALEELTSLVYSKKENGIAINVFTDGEARVTVGKGSVRVVQKTQYPYDGKIQLTMTPSGKETFPLFIRIPDWASTASISINSKPVETTALKPGEYFKVEKAWREKDVVEISFPMELKLHQKTEDAPIPQGGGDIYSVNWFALSRGPLVFAANGLIDGRDRERTVQVPSMKPEQMFTATTNPYGQRPAYQLKGAGAGNLIFVPYFEAGGAKLNNWRLTWIQNKIE